MAKVVTCPCGETMREDGDDELAMAQPADWYARNLNLAPGGVWAYISTPTLLVRSVSLALC